MNTPNAFWITLRTLCIACILVVGNFAFTPAAQASDADSILTLPLNSVVTAQWIAPPDTDVVSYRMYLTGQTTVYTNITFVDNWYTSNSDPGECTYIMPLSVPLGLGYAELTAVDRSGNESARSNRVYFRIIDPAPQAPRLFQFKFVR